MNNHLFDLAGRTVVVTGGGTGLGRATVDVLARAGANVVIAAPQIELIERVAEELRASGAAALALPTDVRDAAGVEAMAARAAEMDVELPAALAATLGPILAVETPPQGRSAFEVVIVTTRRGRFAIKRGTTPATRAELAAESRVLHALQGEWPFVPAPVGLVPEADTEAFAFTYIEGETMLAALQRVDEAQKHALVARFGATLRRIHGWTPPLPRPDDWLSMIIARELARMQAQPAGAVISGTQTRFDGCDAWRVANDLQAWRPGVSTDLAFGHGDYCLPNVLVRRGAVVGVIDWSRGGYADRRFDLATGLFNLRYNLGDAAYLTTFLRAYGYEEPVETLHMFEALHALTCFW